MTSPLLKPTFISEVLRDNPASLAVHAEAAIVREADGQAVICCRHLDVEQFSRRGHCKLEAESTPRPSLFRYWGGEDYDALFSSYQQVVWRVGWNDHTLRVVHLEWDNGCGGDSRDWVVADSVETAESFILDVERLTHAPGEAILVFSNGRWNRSESLYAATQAASFADLILADDLKETIRSDFKRFLGACERYERLGIAWRRGALLIGPPGNGKTHCVRALVKELGVSSLYVQSLSHHYQTPEQLWQQVFDRARGLRPCVLVLEDLDSLVTEENRSFFLNQLDGFEQNHGLIVLATTNHPERIDSAIIDRPSRFDRKYHFNLPTLAERRNYLSSWQHRLADDTGWTEDEIDDIASVTEDFSFAYLKELIISSVMTWMHDTTVHFAHVMTDQVAILASQMKTETESVSGQNGRKRVARQPV